MLILLSPAKNLNEARATGRASTTPRFLDQAEELVAVARGWSESEISRIMQVSPAIAKLNAARFQDWSRDAAAAAGDMFDGDVYRHLGMETLDDTARAQATRRVRILSGLYGLLRPTDAVCAYRMEMGRRLPGHDAGTLYRFWADRIADEVARDARALGAGQVLNLASEEYARSVDRTALGGLAVIAPRFEELRNGVRKVISVSAKRARGAMARWVLEEGVHHPRDLHAFDRDGYRFDTAHSSDERPVFLRA